MTLLRFGALAGALVLTGLAPFLVPSLSAQAPPPPPPPSTACAAVAGLQVVCNQQGPEDLILLPGGQWVIAGAYAGAGGVRLIDVRSRSSVIAYPSTSAANRPDTKTYPGCPSPPGANGTVFTTHGLYLQEGRAGVHKLFVVGHGARESIEVFDVDTRSTTPTFTWTGCAIAPDPIGLNSVRALPDGGFIATNFLSRGGTPAAREQLMAGQRNGELWEWHTVSGWQKVPGSEASGANGIEISNDGRWYYVAAWGSQSFFRLSRGQATPVRNEIPLGFRVDNIHWARNGKLLAAGQAADGSVVVEIDPAAMTTRQVARRSNDASFTGGTVAVEVGDQLWIGSFQGDRIAVLPAR
jgi:hypothetical protein